MTVVADELEDITDICRAHIEDITKTCKWALLPPQPEKETRAIVRERRGARETVSRSRDRVGQREVRANPISEAIFCIFHQPAKRSTGIFATDKSECRTNEQQSVQP